MAGKRGRKPKFVAARKVPIAGRPSGPPAWALRVLLGMAFLWAGTLILIQWTGDSIIPYGRSTWFNVSVLFFPLPALIAVAVAAKLIELRQAQSWAQASGRILSSRIEARRHRFVGAEETVRNEPAIEYEFEANGRTWRGSRIGIGDDTGGAETEATLGRYPAGATVTVHYDPDDPRNCVLERGGLLARLKETPPGQPSALTGVLGLLAFFTVIGGALYWTVVYGTDFVLARFPNAAPEFSLAVIWFGLIVLLFFFAMRRMMKQAQSWPSAPGKVVRSEVTSYQELSDGHSVTRYRPEVEYVYSVRGLDYHSTQVKLGVTVSGGEGAAKRAAEKYKVGDAVAVHYDPADPGNAALENPTGMSWILLLIALAMFGLAAVALGIFQ
jgi:hypothetical protein